MKLKLSTTLPSFLFHKDCLSQNRRCTTACITSITTAHGTLVAIADNNYLYCIQFIESNSLLRTLSYIHRHPELNLCLTEGKNSLILQLEKELNSYESGELESFTIPYKLYGTDFQLNVWQTLTKISYGTTTTYQDIAQKIGSLKGARAVGNANNRNPISIIIPCHRVIGTNRLLTGYAGGINRKKSLLLHENRTLKRRIV